MGYFLSVSRREAAKAVKAGRAQVVEKVPERRVPVYSEYGDYLGEEVLPAENFLVVDGIGLLSVGKGEYDAHCSMGGTLGDRVMAALDKAGIKYRRID